MPSQKQQGRVAKTVASAMTSGLINFLAKRYSAQHYLEIGVRDGDTFFSVAMPDKVAVDPRFSFDPKPHASKKQRFYPITSDAFFEQLATKGSDAETALSRDRTPVTFDIIFIDGLHTFEQSWRDFKNCQPYAHKNTLFVLDDTIPCDPYSSIQNPQLAVAYRKQAGLEGNYWHGDVYKTVFAIHDFYPEYSYCTLLQQGNPQTLVWYTGDKSRKPIFSSLEEIARLNYFDLLHYAHVLMPVDMPFGALLGKTLNPQQYARPDDWKKLFYRIEV